MTDALVAFLKARLDDDERVASGTRTPLDWHQGPGTEDPEWADDEMVLMWPPEFHTPYGQDKHWRGLTTGAELAAHIARHDPARTLREVEAKRMIVDAHGRDHECISLTGSGETNAIDGKPWALWEPEHTADAERPCFVLRALALPYADHPGYLEEWRP